MRKHRVVNAICEMQGSIMLEIFKEGMKQL